ncbi:MAG: CDP-diacylglycerol--serine O-phosphatidyltransferase [Opitutaceae bacterium]|nr:CDP-diacylglycerol--serine O-phosphatidyltransferase [Opitutaceae bacterium]|tara:strand:- start:117 stop:962 length:846 start_codon:yes stop_codon:yes gene_type:complete
MSEPPMDPKYTDPDQASKIYFLPNSMTAFNLFCGFAAVIRCIQARFTSEELGRSPEELYSQAVWLILAAVVFDILDGRLARLGGRESLFGKEFDSIADVVSFGVAPALMVFLLILSPDHEAYFRQIGWLIGFIYLLCVGVRLSRFNVVTHPLMEESEFTVSKDFIGLPAPAAAGTISSLVLWMNKFDVHGLAILLPALMILIAVLMISSIHYPSFKYIDWTTRLKFRTFVLIIVVISIIVMIREIGITLIFMGYIFYGLFLDARDRWRNRNSDDPNNPVNS